MIKRILTLLLAILALNVYSQQEAQYSHYMFAPAAYNPGYFGLEDAICLNGIHREQWMGLEATTPTGESYSINPVTSMLSVDAAIHPLYGGIGLNFMQDEIGPFTNTMVELGYAYHHNIGPGKLGIGIMAGFLDQTIDFTKFNYLDPGDPVLEGGGKEESAIAFDLKFGGYYRVPGSWYAGISTSKLLQSKMDLGKDLAGAKLKRHYYLTGGYTFRLPHPDFKLEPSALIKSDLAATQYDLTTLVWYMDQFYSGLTYRPNDAVSVLVGMKGWASAAGFSGGSGTFQGSGSMVGFSYDVTTSSLGADGRSAGTFEVFLRYCFNIEIPKVMHGHEVVR